MLARPGLTLPTTLLIAAEAVAACEAAIRIQPDHARAHLRLADAQAADKRRDLALVSLEEAVRLDPRLWEARYLLGVEYAMGGQIEPAREQFAEVVRLKPDHLRGQFNLGIALALQRKWEEAITHLGEALRLDPKNEAARKALAEAAVERHDFVAAAALLDQLPGPMQVAAGETATAIRTHATADGFIAGLRAQALAPATEATP